MRRGVPIIVFTYMRDYFLMNTKKRFGAVEVLVYHQFYFLLNTMDKYVYRKANKLFWFI